MILITLLGCAIVVSACSPQREGLWIVQEGEWAAKAASCLGVWVSDLKDLNDGKDLNTVFPGQVVTVPYISSVTSAIWNIKTMTTGGTAACKAYLEMDPSTTLATRTKTSTATSTADPEASSKQQGTSTASKSNSKPARVPGETSPRSQSSPTAVESGQSSTTSPAATNADNREKSAAAKTTETGRDPSSMAADAAVSTQVSSIFSGADASSNPSTTAEVDSTARPSSAAPDARTVAQPSSTWTSAQSISTTVTVQSPTTSAASGAQSSLTFNHGQRYCNSVKSTDAGTDDLALEQSAKKFCELHRAPLDENNVSFHKNIVTGNTKFPYYLHSVTWNTRDPNCLSKQETIDTTLCIDMMRDNFKKCNNGGRGGSIEKGCVLYEFQPIDLLRA